MNYTLVKLEPVKIKESYKYITLSKFVLKQNINKKNYDIFYFIEKKKYFFS